MQKWRPWETANEVEWGLAVERESVIRPLAEEEKLTNVRLPEAMLRLGVSRSALYKLVQRYRDRPQTSSLLPWKRSVSPAPLVLYVIASVYDLSARMPVFQRS